MGTSPHPPTPPEVQLLSCLAVSQNHIPVLSPALTDGSLGDMIFFHSYKKPGLVLDIVEGEVLGPQRSGRGGLAGPMA